MAGNGNLSGDSQHNILQLLGALLGISLLSGQLGCLLLHVLGQHLLGAVGSDDALAGGDEIVAAITALHVNDIVLVAKSDNIFFQYNLHDITSSFNYFIKSVT